MVTATDLADAISTLAKAATTVSEEISRLSLTGTGFNETVRQALIRILEVSDELDLGAPTLRLDDQYAYLEDISNAGASFNNWMLIAPKTTSFTQSLRARDDENTLVFFSVNGLHQWLQAFDPFNPSSDSSSDLTSKATTIRVHGLQSGFGGQLLWILPLDSGPPSDIPTAPALPTTEDVHKLIHVVTTSKAIRVSPQSFALTWGDIDTPEAVPLVTICAKVLSASIVQELRPLDEEYQVTIHGAKRVSLHLVNNASTMPSKALQLLMDAVVWVYEERSETRLKLVMDRLSLDVDSESNIVSELIKHLEEALQQAKDSYTFVILERKDAYHKEMRELLKDVRAQADLYASKVRDLVSALTRDMLGIFFFLGFSFVGRFDRLKLHDTLTSVEFSLLVKFLAGYLVISCALQLITHWQDAQLAFKETAKWRTALKNYTSRQENETLLLGPISVRRKVLWIAMGITALMYFMLAVVTWNLPFVATLLMSQ